MPSWQITSGQQPSTSQTQDLGNSRGGPPSAPPSGERCTGRCAACATAKCAAPAPAPQARETPYCGANLETPKDSKIQAKANSWDLNLYLDRMFRATITLPTAEVDESMEFFLSAAQTEFDAEFLCRYLEKSNVVWTPEFIAFEREWRRDEYRHYVGFRRVFGRLYPALGESWLKDRVENAISDFEPIREFLRDEFNVLAAIVFDEACTAKSYSQELKFYAKLGDSVFQEWIRHIAQDEVNHMRNALAVLRVRHQARLSELPQILDSFIAHDSSGAGYRNTFLFDHECYSSDFVAGVVTRLKRQIAI